MAVMLPDDPAYYYNGSMGETNIFNSLSQHLNDDWVVVHSFRWLKLNPASGDKAQGEGDFVLFHKDLGVLVIEVKGGDIEVDKGKWFSTDHHGVKNLIQDPEKQANRTRYQIVERMEANQIKGVPVYHAVWFPDVKLEKIQLPANLNVYMTFDEEALNDPETPIRNAFDFWSRNTGFSCNSLSRETCEQVEALLRPRVKLTRSLKRISNDLNETYIRLTNEQLMLFENLELCKELSIIGRAGTGKTVVANEKAKAEAESGNSVLQLCFNTELAKKIKEIQHPSVDIYTVHSFVYQYMKATYPARVRGEFVTEEDFDYLMSEFMEVSSETALQYDVIIIDEGQDFKPGWIRAITAFRAQGSSLYVFYDPYQQLYSSDVSMDEDYLKFGVPYSLKRNMRNTDQISAASLNIIGLPHPKDSLSGVRGIEPKVVCVPFGTDYRARVSTEIHHLLFKEHLNEDDITVLTLASVGQSRVKEEDVHSTCFTTVRKFKGLENDVIIIVDADLSHLIDPVKQRLLYTAISRARVHVILFVELGKHFLNLTLSKFKCTEDELCSAIQQYVTKGEFDGADV